MLAINSRPPTTGREKGGRGRETYKLNIKTALLITIVLLLIIIIIEIKQNTQN